ncbi:hypothetical protein AAG906_029040 [Vitis piasezkii]
MAMALTTKNKIGFIDGTIPRAAKTGLLFNAWNRSNNMVTSTQEFSTITGLSLLRFTSMPFHQGDVGYASVNAHPGNSTPKGKRSDLNVAIVDCRVIPLIVVTNCMDTHLGTSLDPKLNWVRPKLIKSLLLSLRT